MEPWLRRPERPGPQESGHAFYPAPLCVPLIGRRRQNAGAEDPVECMELWVGLGEKSQTTRNDWLGPHLTQHPGKGLLPSRPV